MIFNETYDELLASMKLIETIGVDCRQDAQCKQLYREAKDARAEARQIERQFYKNEGDDTSHNYWLIVAKHALTLLVDFSRDVEVMSWLLESLCRLDGYQGCAFSFEVITIFTEKFSHHLFPHVEQDDPQEWQWISLTGLNGDQSQGSLIIPLNSVKICLDPPVALWEYQHLSFAQNNSQASSNTINLTIPLLLEHLKENGSSFLINTLNACDDCLHSLEKMTETLFLKISDGCPPTSRIKDALEKAKSDIQYLAKQAFGESVLVKPKDKTTEISNHLEKIDSSSASLSNISVNNASIMNRSKAIQGIHEIALFFQNTEPHTPIPYMLRRVIAWSKLSWPELMQTMIHNKDEIENIIQQTGMPVE